MKAVRIGAPFNLDTLEFVDIEDPGKPGPSEVRVRILASSLNYHDYAVVTGQIPAADGRIPMSDGAGIVEEVGRDVGEFAVGDRVVSTFFPTWMNGAPPVADFSTTPGDGVDGFASTTVVRPATSFTKAPHGYSHAEAATLTTAGLTAWRALAVNGALKAGDSVLVMGTGGVSIFALQFAKAMGATVIATSSSDEKLVRCKTLGADHCINYRTTKEWGKAVGELTQGRGVDHVVEVGGPGTLAQSIQACRIGGHISLIGILTGWEGPVPTAALMIKQQNLRGIIVGSRDHQKEMVRGLEATGIKPVIDSSWDMDRLGDAFRHEESGSHFGKICLDIAKYS